MIKITIDNETLRVSASSERAIAALDRNAGACAGSDLWYGAGRRRSKDEIDAALGIEVRDFAGVSSPPPWVADFAAANPRSRVRWGVTESSWDRFEQVARAIKAVRADR